MRSTATGGRDVAAQSFELLTLARLNVDAGVQREPTGLRGAAMVTLLLSLGHRTGRQCLQREQLLPGARAHRDPVGDGMADQVIERAAWPVDSEPGVLHVALDEAALLKQSSYALSDLLHQPLQLRCGRCRHMAEYRLIATRHGAAYEVMPDRIETGT